VLRKTAEVLQKNMRKQDIAGRYGGEEFLIILPSCSVENGLIIAERIRDQVENLNFTTDGLKITISMGLVGWDGENSEDLIKKADVLLYQAKDVGRNRIETE